VAQLSCWQRCVSTSSWRRRPWRARTGCSSVTDRRSDKAFSTRVTAHSNPLGELCSLLECLTVSLQHDANLTCSADVPCVNVSVTLCSRTSSLSLLTTMTTISNNNVSRFCHFGQHFGQSCDNSRCTHIFYTFLLRVLIQLTIPGESKK